MAAIGSTVGITALATDADAGDTVSYALTNDAGGLFTIDSTTGVVTTAGSLDYETATSHTVTVEASSTDGSSDTSDFTINVNDETSPHVDLNQPMQVYHISGGVYGSGFKAAYDVRPDVPLSGTLYEVVKSSDGKWYRVPNGRTQSVDQGEYAGSVLALSLIHI